MKYGHEIKRIVKKRSENYTLVLQFMDGEKVTVNLNFLFDKPRGLALEIVRGDMFEKCFVESGALAWPNGYELCPDSLRAWAEEQRKDRVA